MARPFSVPQIAERFGVTTQTVRNWIASGRLRSVQTTPRGRHRIDPAALASFERDAFARSAQGVGRDAPAASVGRPASGRNPALTMGPELARLVGAIVAAIGPEAVVLFGSRARGDATSGSDFDLAILTPNGTSRRRLVMQAYEAVARVEGRTAGVDIVVLTPAIIAAERDLVGSVARAVARDGVLVYGSASIN